MIDTINTASCVAAVLYAVSCLAV